MATRYELFNEVTFVAYVKSAIDRSVLKERIKKAERNRLEQPYSVLTDAMLCDLSHEDSEISRVERNCRTFQTQGINVPIYNEKLGEALSCLMPRDREIILLYFFIGTKTQAIARIMNISPATVRRHRKTAIRKLRDYLEAAI